MSDPIRVIVCGGRDMTSLLAVKEALDEINAKTPIGTVIHGNARGADTLAGQWAHSRGIKCFPVPAKWEKHGKAAGPKRNQAMLGMGAKLVVAFPGGKGTADMVRRAKRAGVEVVEITP